MSEEGLDPYIQALVDTKQFDPTDETEFDHFIADAEKRDDENDAGVWLIRIYRNYGTKRASEFIRISASEDGEISAARVDNEHYKEVLSVEPNMRNFVKYILASWAERAKKIDMLGEPKPRKDCEESVDGDPFSRLHERGLEWPKIGK